MGNVLTIIAVVFTSWMHSAAAQQVARVSEATAGLRSESRPQILLRSFRLRLLPTLSIRRRFSRALGLGRFDPPGQVVGKARKRLFNGPASGANGFAFG